MVSLCFSSVQGFTSIHVRKTPPKLSAVSCTSSSSSNLPAESYEATNFYKLLSLSSNRAGVAEIKQAYRTMALKYHPDVCHDPSLTKQCTNMFLLLQTAYNTLSDPLSRAEYDRQLGSAHIRVGHRHTRSIQTSVWEAQIAELRKRSNYRAAAKEERSWPGKYSST